MVSEAIRVENLVKRFKDVTAVDGVSFTVREGEIYGLLGPNGAGKTTTIHILTTLLRPTSGRALVAGYDVVKQPSEVRKRIGIVFQDPSLDNQLTAWDNMYIHGMLYGLGGQELKRKINELLDFVELKNFANKQVKYFSGGMRRRLEIARALLHEPEILFLDEPTIGLDPQTRVKIWDYIMAIKKEKGMTIVLTTHYMDEAEQLCDRIAIMDRGKIIAEGTSDELKALVGNEVIYLKLDGSAPACLEADFISSCRIVSGGLVELSVKNASQAMPRVFELAEEKGLKIVEVTYRRPTLNEVFIHLTGRELRDSLEESPRPPHRRW
ncbi:ATP-binding cassette domain-containing protein [Thermofilum pendens]|uniref:Daunorubicin resistance ABC transporter ATPase subunit n=1 Tax=Thermofilum pendens (strain DSM 2475 / Hrk 5) TaxID=368408 RepID=A1S0K9_THEPD|nr:ATP-binding cassette domain-containing protein [Thermofilum pendens]ABL78989.1 daunorubicin resistance ABC transporter ATPase subunit [Thermofilum pendens Hrk 5]